jgi:hypothetical protein
MVIAALRESQPSLAICKVLRLNQAQISWLTKTCKETQVAVLSIPLVGFCSGTQIDSDV